MELLFKHIWMLFIVATVANGLALKHRAKKYIAEKPERRAGYEACVKGLMIYGNIPWLIVGIGNLSGWTDSIFDYFNPRAMNPVVLLLHACIVLLWILGLWWIYGSNGAEWIERHPGIFRKTSFSGNTEVTAKQIKRFFPVLILAGVTGMIIMWTMDFTPP